MSMNQEFSTYDLGCSAALICAGFELVYMDKTNPRKVRFLFCQKDGIEETVNDYFLGKLEVKARLMFDNLKNLKNMILSQ